MGSKRTVALIEDRPDNAEVLRILLTSESGLPEVPWFKSGQEFLATFEPGSFALILLDIALPGMDGYGVLREIRAKDPDVPVIALTAYAYPADRERALRAGFTDYVAKPIVDFDHFSRIIARHIDPRQSGSGASA